MDVQLWQTQCLILKEVQQNAQHPPSTQTKNLCFQSNCEQTSIPGTICFAAWSGCIIQPAWVKQLNAAKNQATKSNCP